MVTLNYDYSSFKENDLPFSLVEFKRIIFEVECSPWTKRFMQIFDFKYKPLSSYLLWLHNTIKVMTIGQPTIRIQYLQSWKQQLEYNTCRVENNN